MTSVGAYNSYFRHSVYIHENFILVPKDKNLCWGLKRFVTSSWYLSFNVNVSYSSVFGRKPFCASVTRIFGLPKESDPQRDFFFFFCALFVLSRKGGQEVGFQAGHWMSEIPVRYRGWAHRWQWSRLYAEMGSSERKSDVVVIGMFCEIFKERRGEEQSGARVFKLLCLW